MIFKENNKKAFINFFIIIFGLIFILWVIYLRFIRERLPKSLPLILSESSFFFILYICLVYLFMVIILIRNPIKESFKDLNYIKDIILLPLKKVDHLLKYNFIFESTFKRLITWFIELNFKLSELAILNILCLLTIVPRFCVILAFLIDILIFKELNLVYELIVLALFPLICKYTIYSIKDFSEYNLKELEKNYNFVSVIENDDSMSLPEDFTSEKILPLKEYAIFKKNQKLNINYTVTYNNYTYNTIRIYLESVILKNDNILNFEKKNNYTIENTASELYEPLYEEYNNKMPIIINCLIISERYNLIEHVFLRKIRVCVFSCYFFCWFFVLTYSYFFFPVTFENFFSFIITWQKYFINEIL